MPSGHTGEAEVQLYPFSKTELQGARWSAPCPWLLILGKRLTTYCTKGKVGHGAGLNGYRISHPTRVSTQEPPSPQ